MSLWVYNLKKSGFISESVIDFNMNWTNIIALITLVSAFLGVVVSLIIGINNNVIIIKDTKESNFILNATVERNKWLERIRKVYLIICGLTKF